MSGNIPCIIYDMFTYDINWKVTWLQLACSFCLIETEGLLEITDGHMHCECGNISETAEIETLLLLITNRKLQWAVKTLLLNLCMKHWC